MTIARRLMFSSVFISALASAQVPALVGYQGRLLTASGAPVNGVVQITFAIFDSPAGGAEYWRETQQLGLSEGYYSTLLGAPNDGGVTSGIFSSPDRYLEVSVNGTTLTPRQRIGSVPYALVAATAQSLAGGAVSSTSVNTTTINTNTLVSSTINASSISAGQIDAGQLLINGTIVIDSTGTYVGPAVVAAAAPLTLNGKTMRLSGCPNADQQLVWDGSAWVCRATALRAGNGIAIDAGTVLLQPCAAGQALVAQANGSWSCTKVPAGSNAAGAFSTYTLSVDGSAAVPSLQCTAGDLIVSCISLQIPGGGAVCGTSVSNNTCTTSQCSAQFGSQYRTQVTCLRVQ